MSERFELRSRLDFHPGNRRIPDEEHHPAEKEKAYFRNLAHDLQNRICAIKLSAHLLKERHAPHNEQGSDLLETIIQSCAQAALFLQEEVTAANRMSDPERPVAQSLDIRPIVFQEIQLMQSLADQKDITMRIADSEEHPILVATDRISLGRVLNNLLSNAIKFSPRGGTVQIRIECDPKRSFAQVRIRDNGVGLTEEDQKYLFFPHYRPSAKPTNGEVSTGLGLGIVHQLLKRMGGDIGCDSEPMGGASFWISVPLA